MENVDMGDFTLDELLEMMEARRAEYSSWAAAMAAIGEDMDWAERNAQEAGKPRSGIDGLFDDLSVFLASRGRR